MHHYRTINDYTTDELFEEIRRRFDAINEIIYQQAKKIQNLKVTHREGG